MSAAPVYLTVEELAAHLHKSPRWVLDRVKPSANACFGVRLPHRRVSANRPPDFSPEHVAQIDAMFEVCIAAEPVLAGFDPKLIARSRRALAAQAA
jgi:hypothetical protein